MTRIQVKRRLSPNAEGAIFETRLKLQAMEERIAIVQMPTGSRSIGHVGKRPTLIPVKTPFDFTVIKHGETAFFDAKSTDEKRFAHSKITKHQVEKLAEIESQGVAAGYVIHFRQSGLIVFMPASRLKAVKPRESLGRDDGLPLGTIDEFKLSILFGGEK